MEELAEIKVILSRNKLLWPEELAENWNSRSQRISWSRNKAIANRFPYTNRHKVPEPLLVTATVAKGNVLAVKLGRDEDGVITFGAASLEGTFRSAVP